MSGHCVVYGCPNKGSIQLAFDPLIPVSFHRFPNKLVSPELHDKWLQQLRIPGFSPSSGSVVCSIHFTTDDFQWKEPLQCIQLKARFFPGDYHPPTPHLKNTAFPSLNMTVPPTDESQPMCEAERLKKLKKKGGKLKQVENKKQHVSTHPYRHLTNKKENKFVDKGIQCELGVETYRSQPGVISKCEILEKSPAECNGNIDWLNADGDVDSSSSSEDSYQVTSASEHDSESEYSSTNDYEEDEILTTSIMGINEQTRAGNNAWCKCSVCLPMNTEYESSCCHDCEAMLKVRETHDCVTSHESFESVVLNEHTLNTTRHCMALNNASLDAKNELKAKTNRLLRHIAYKQFIHWVNSVVSFGHNQIKTIPACVIFKVRKTFPEISGDYSELEPAKRGYEPDYFD